MNQSRAEQTASSDVYSGCLGSMRKVDSVVCRSSSPKTDHHVLDKFLLLVPNSDHQLIEPGLGVRGVGFPTRDTSSLMQAGSL